jgi:glycosyltransferase involved in cell wall biosynthesis
MALLLNYRPVLRQPSGIGVVANALLPALQQLPHVLVPGGEQGTAKQRLHRLAWTQLALPRLAQRQQASLIFTPAPEGYLGAQAIPQVVMVHDLRPISHPERSLQSVYFRSWVPSLLRQCRHILTNSQFTASEIHRHTGVAHDRITVIPLGYDAEAFRPDLSSVETEERPYFLHVGQAYPHKNLSRLIRAFAPLAAQHCALRLVLAGKPHPTETSRLKALVEELGLGEQVDFRPYVSFEELPGLYRRALALVYPSLWEGFGLPLLEAMACGTPVLTSFGSGTEEVAGNAAFLINPLDLGALSTALSELFHQSALRGDLRCRGLVRVGAFGWDQARVQAQHLIAQLM